MGEVMAKTKYEPLDVELTDTLMCSYAHHNTAEPCWGAVVFRGIAPTCVGHSKMVSVGYYISQEQVEKVKTTGGTLRRSPNRAATAMQIPEELTGVWQAPPKDKVLPEISVVLPPTWFARRPGRVPPTTSPQLVDVRIQIDTNEQPINAGNQKITVSDDTEIPESWEDYL